MEDSRRAAGKWQILLLQKITQLRHMETGARASCAARRFGVAWARRKFPDEWETKLCEGTVVGRKRGDRWAVRYDTDDSQ